MPAITSLDNLLQLKSLVTSRQNGEIQGQDKITPRAVQADQELDAPRGKEIRVVLKNCSVIDPENIEDYIAKDGYQALASVVTQMTPEQVIDTVNRSGLRGRGGAGFPTFKKWQLARDAKDSPKYIVCNADEGDPGAFMNRRVLESDPHSVVEGMIIAAYAIGASRGYIYCRAEYPLAVKTLNIAINQAREFGFLGENIRVLIFHLTWKFVWARAHLFVVKKLP
jgi:NADH:ubiquinone oxidoreductase subunit F (NADH-binding)